MILGASFASNCVASDNSNNWSGGGMLTMSSHISQCLATRNCASNGGGIAVSAGSIIEHCTITGNTARFQGGGVWKSPDHWPARMANVLIAGNSATEGGGIYAGDAYSGALNLRNCTVAGNTATNGLGGCILHESNVEVCDSIFYQNSHGNFTNRRDSTWMRYNCSYPLMAGTGSISNDPQFVCAQSSDYRLQPGSPCTDAGQGTEWIAGNTDLDGNPRVVYGRIDMGAYEFVSGPLWCGFSAAPSTSSVDETVFFTARAGGSNHAAISYHWDFYGDFSSDTNGPDLDSPVWAYPDAGVYTVRLVVQNTAGEASSFSVKDCVTVIPEPALAWCVLSVLALHAGRRRVRHAGHAPSTGRRGLKTRCP
ncbi:PKD domain-containing protein [bacterium]|nr:PKD domain-containing protein [bacterium]